MKKYFFFTALMMAIFFSTSLYAQQADVKKFYVGAGGSYDNKVNVIIPLAVKVSL